MDAALLARELVRGGYELTMDRVETEPAMRAALARSDWDVIISDYSMPLFSAPAALELLKGTGRDIPFIIVSGTVNEDIAIAAIHAGAKDFMAKGRLGRLIPAIERERRAHAARIERAAMQREVDEARERLQAILRFAPVLITAVDEEGTIEFLNRALQGREVAELLGTRLVDNLEEPGRSRVTRALQRLTETGETQAFDVDYVGASGQASCFSCVMGPIRDGGRFAGAVIIAQDVTALKRSQARLAVSDRLASVGSLAAGIAHDFNNILSVILSFATFVHDDLERGDERRRDLEEVLKAAERAVALTSRLMLFARQQPRSAKPVDLNLRLDQLKSLLTQSVTSSIRLAFEPAQLPPVVCIDPVEFDQLVLNLVVNARDAMPTGGDLRVRLEHPAPAAALGADAETVRLVVEDTGVGMDDVVKARIFDPFFTTKEPGKGTGLGLATCFGLVKQAGGHIDIQSRVGHGTTFSVELPRSGGDVEATAAPFEDVPLGRGQSILVVEDEAALRRATIRLLRDAGYVTHAAADGNEALALVEQLGSSVDLVLTDLVMPGLGGAELHAALRRRQSDAAVLFTTGYGADVARLEGLDVPNILWKPVREPDLLRAVGAALAGRASRPPSPGGALTMAAPGVELVIVAVADDVDNMAITSILRSAGYSVAHAPGLALARSTLERRPDAWFLVCDAVLPDGRADDLLRELRLTRPKMAGRVVVLAPADPKGDALQELQGFPVLPRPISPKRILEVLTVVPVLPSRPRRDPRPTNERLEVPTVLDVGPRRERILFVDDDVALLSAGERILDRAGFEVVTATTIAEARNQLSRGGYDAVVTDIGLPDGDGLDLIPSLRGDNLEVPVVMVTGAPSVATAARAVRSGVHEYLAKPFQSDVLVKAVRSAVAAGRVARLRTKLLAARFGGDEFVGDLERTERLFASALGQIRMVYQPIIRSSDRSIYGFEALLRCDEKALASPAKLLAAAEVLGHVNELGQATRASIAGTLEAFPERLEMIFVNVHPAEVQSGMLMAATDALLPFARRVIIEVTERASLEGTPQIQDELRRLRDAGYRIAVDDLGEGYAGLSSLVNLRPDICKIDMSLVRDIDQSPLKRDIVSAIVDMARRSGIGVVAEGIETEAECAVVTRLGCDLLQGYLFARPGPPFPAVSFSDALSDASLSDGLKVPSAVH
ncbi:MAG: response regulator [Myxococcales bacterium]|nr:response regulator [Myxococcales bacterium]